MKILISGAGTSDPVRGDHDAGLLHIIRHYRPEKIYLLLTSEMTDFERKDHRFTKMCSFIREHWTNYSFELNKIDLSLPDPSDMDASSAEIEPIISDILKSERDATFLYNLSSGTPQMKMIFMMHAVDTRYRSIGVQVKNPEKRAGTAPRVTEGYPIEESLMLNLDESEDYVDRCEEPKLVYIQRKQQEDQTVSLIKRYDYAAVSDMDQITLAVKPLVKHLMYRSVLESEQAKKYAGIAKQCDPDLIPLYPYFRKQPNPKKQHDLETIIEYYLSLKNLQKIGDYTDFVLRLNPFFTALETEALIKFLPYELDKIADKSKSGWKIIRFKFERQDPEFSSFVDKMMQEDGRPGYKDRSDFNQYLLKTMLQYFDKKLSSQTFDFMDRVYQLNYKKRNPAAHELVCVTEEEIRDVSGLGSRNIISKAERMLLEIIPEINKDIFSIYERCNQYIISRLN